MVVTVTTEASGQGLEISLQETPSQAFPLSATEYKGRWFVACTLLGEHSGELLTGRRVVMQGYDKTGDGAVARPMQLVQTDLPNRTGCHLAPNNSLSLLWRWLVHQLVRRPVLALGKLTHGIAVDAENAPLG